MSLEPKFSLFPSLPSLMRNISLFDEDFAEAKSHLATNVQLSEDDKHVFVEANVPGLSDDEIDITVDKGMLWIKGEHQMKEEDPKKKFYYKVDRSVSYRLMLPGELEEYPSEAELVDGVLHITFNKKQKESPKRINIKRR